VDAQSLFEDRLVDCGLQICSNRGCMYRTDEHQGAVPIGLFLWVYRALFVGLQGSFGERKIIPYFHVMETVYIGLFLWICSDRWCICRALFADMQ